MVLRVADFLVLVSSYSKFNIFSMISPTLVPFGLNSGDTLLPSADDDSFGPYLLDPPLVIYDTVETQFYVSMYH